MKKALLFILLFLKSVFTHSDCFTSINAQHHLVEEGECTARHPPCSSFKIAISLMAFNEGLLINEFKPELPFKKGYADTLDVWRHAQTPASWIKNSCVWYSQLLTTDMGMDKFQLYVNRLHYGNQNLTGDPGKNNGLTRAWLSSSLKISPKEQLEFIEQLYQETLAVNGYAQEQTKHLLFIETLPNGWKLYGKTGSGTKVKADGSHDDARQFGWFIGWLEKDQKHISFVQYIEDTQKEKTYAGLRAKTIAKSKLLKQLES